ncbi:MAG: sporulation/spore germination protein [Microcoleus sp. SIO2G3]|nr:sporulation/spore germination protein [Microcoleus sp. SIO2G3]
MAIVTRFSQAGLALLITVLGGCSIAPTVPPREISDSTAIESVSPLQTIPPATPRPAATPAADTVNAKIYSLDTQCQWFQQETVALPKAGSLEAAIGTVLAEQQSSDFDLSGYRVIRRPNGELIIDFRLPTNTKRQFTSLSSCEQLALFGSLRQTLLRNPQWGIKLIRFRDRGRAIVL